ncbi:MAG TPA: autotransporter domain-containing protein [Candidatus Duodenibacillus intestinigallinarum]|nr:autotransporter domain-containing protein [Candidatus Duodenibacillus intestinigallinarum]
MNRTFKVVFNKARGALMVANEATSSVQKKGAKLLVTTVVASALSCGVMAADVTGQVSDQQTWGEGTVLKGDVVLDSGAQVIVESEVANKDRESNITINDGAVLTVGSDKADMGLFVGGDFNINGGEVSVTGTEEGGQTQSGNITKAAATIGGYDNFKMSGGTLNLTNARAWVGSWTSSTTGKTNFNEMVLSGGTINLDNGGITGMSGKVDEQPVGTTIRLSGSNINVNGGQHNVINSLNIEMSAGEINVAEKTSLQISTYNKDGLEWGSEYDQAPSQNFVMTGGKLTNNGSVDVDAKQWSIQNATVVNNGDMDLGNTDLVIGSGGRVETALSSDSFLAKTVTLNEGGIFHVAGLNSNADNDEEGPKNRLLIAGTTLNLAGGTVLLGEDAKVFKGHLKLGTSSIAGEMNVVAGAYELDKMEFGSHADNALTIADGTLTVREFDASNGKTTVSGGGVLASKVIKYTEGSDGKVELKDGGTLRTSGKNIFERSGEGEGASWGLSGFAEANFTENSVDEGILEITDSFKGSLTDLRKAQAMLEGTTLYFSNVTLTDEEITFDENNGLTTANKEVTAGASKNGTTTLQLGSEKNVGVGAIRVDADTTVISISDSDNATAGALLISGMPNGGNVITGVDSVEKLTTTGAIQLGLNAGSQGVVNANLVKADDVTVLGNFRLNDLEINSLDVDQGAFLTLNKLTGNGPASIEGGLSANVIATETTVENGGVLVIGERQAKESSVEEGGEQAGSEATQQLMLASVRTGDEPAAPTQPSEMVGQIQDVVHGAVGSVTTTNANGAAALVAAGFDSTKQAGLYIDDTIGVESTGTLLVGTASPVSGNGSVILAEDTFAVINVGELAGKTVFAAKELKSAATIVLDNVTGLGTLTLLEGGTVSNEYESEIRTASALFDAQVNEEDNKLIDIAYNKGVAGDIDSVVEGLVTKGTDVKNMNVLNALANKNNGFVGSDNKFTASGIQAAKEYLAAPVTAGTYNMAYDSMELISNALIQRNLDAKKGLGVWADVFYGSNESDSLYGDSGYSSDIYGGMLGVDFGFGEGARVGAALSIGSGDGDSEGSVSKYSTDSDFWGLSVYAGKDFGGLTFTGDMSYLWLDNDIGGSVAGASASESLDSTVFSLGVRADWKAYEGKVLQVVPHAGVRWASIDVDDYRGLSMDKMNVIEMPIGVTVKGVFETASGWQVAPEIDFTAAPQIGDTEVETIIGDVDVIDNVYNASIGVNAGTDAVRFGLSYKYGFGNDGRSNNTFNLKASYLF